MSPEPTNAEVGAAIAGQLERESDARATQARIDEAWRIIAAADPSAPRSVVQALARVKAKIPAVGKDRRVQGSESYAYRGIDDILAAVQRHSADEGIVIIPEDLEWTSEPWPHYRGESWRLYRLKVAWTIYGPDGSSIATVNWGEALDNGDKAMGKARSYAQKDLLVRIYEIPTGDPDLGDTEATTAEPAPPPAPTIELATAEQVAGILARLEAAMVAADGDYPAGWRDSRAEAGRPGTYSRDSLEAMVAGERATPPLAAITVMDQLLDGPAIQAALDEADAAAVVEADAAKARFEAARIDEEGPYAPIGDQPAETPADTDKRPCDLCGSTRSHRVQVGDTWRCERANDCARRAAELEETRTADTVLGAGEICAGCGAPISEDQALTYDDDGRTFHAEHNPTLGGSA